MSEPISLERPVEVIRIPGGEVMTLDEATDVIVTQALGGSFTIVTPADGAYFRLAGQDADAIGQDVPAEAQAAPAEDLETAVWNQLRTCFDPEIPVNIVDLGLIYSLELSGEAPAARADIKMTLTAPGCGMGPTIAGEAERKIRSLPEIADACVELVWDPPWTPERISPEGKERLGISN